MSPPHAVIAGAGIGGLCSALCLARAGWRVSLYEKAKILEESGAGLQLSPNACAVLRKLGVLERLTPFALAPQAIRIRRARDGATLALMPLNDAEARWGAPYLVVHRADLQRALLDAVAHEGRISLQTDAAVTGFAYGSDGVAVAISRGASRLEATGDCLIGADGLRSFVRQKLSPDDLNFSGRTAWRAVVEADRVPAAMRSEETTLWLGRKAHLVHYPLRQGTIINVVAIVDEDFQPDTDNFWSSHGASKFLEARFSRWDKSARDLLSAAPEWRKWPLADRAPAARLVSGRVALLGDAAHPMLPFLAQGAAQAIEDAGVLAEVLARGQDVEASFRAYQEIRLPRVTRVQKESRRQAVIYHLGGPAAFLRDAAMRALGGETMLARYDWLYRVRESPGQK
ncbi:FAD-dependent monooxygenase [Methylocapsa sp. D3K7]|uniref:FAD-dependent monooxygenase n=1 Tax=Methylocapsa sp. D3K7 TaxID=3041435 RepID=UPI00244ED428|nr:FAD-dependent monooxygenase [Methylocapsa sp. D3K7]WGJ14835.1 FAD-dependent monooxygenase [Methylocapsa sp. D3K7]